MAMAEDLLKNNKGLDTSSNESLSHRADPILSKTTNINKRMILKSILEKSLTQN